MAATHLTRVDRVDKAHQGLSFFRYGCSIVVETPNGTMQTLHGNTLVHLFTPPFPPYANTPQPPLEGRTERAWIEVFCTSYELPDAPRTAPLERPQQSFRLHQEIPENGPAAESRVLRLLGRPNNGGQNKDKTTPAVVVSYQLNQKKRKGK